MYADCEKGVSEQAEQRDVAPAPVYKSRNREHDTEHAGKPDGFRLITRPGKEHEALKEFGHTPGPNIVEERRSGPLLARGKGAEFEGGKQGRRGDETCHGEDQAETHQV